MSASAYARVLQYLTVRLAAHTPMIAADCGVRNVPDVIARLRADGHVIQTYFVTANYKGHEYHRIAEYEYREYNPKKAKTQYVPRPYKKKVARVLGDNLEKLNLKDKECP